MNLEKISDYSGRQFGVFRALFGLYLLWHFIALIPHGRELFSNADGVMAGMSPFLGKWWNPLFIEGSEFFIIPMLIVACGAALLFMIGYWRRFCALFLLLIWSCLFTANPLIANPSLGYIGMLLLLCVIIPGGEGFTLGFPARLQLKVAKTAKIKPWGMPAMACVTAWFLMSAGYTFSGLFKLGSPSWVDGSAMLHLLENPLARPGLARDLMLSLPAEVLKTMSWGILGLEILFLPLILIKRLRPWLWLAMLGMHLGIMLTVDFADLSMGMVMVHLFTFQRSWLPHRSARPGGKHVLFIDGECSFCNQTARLMSSIDSKQTLHFSSLQGNYADEVLPDDWQVTRVNGKDVGAVVLLEQMAGEEDVYWRGADAILRVFFLMGGAVSLLWILHKLPELLKTSVYGVFSSYRISALSKACPLPTPEQQKRYIS